jgi:hypothetical protein
LPLVYGTANEDLAENDAVGTAARWVASLSASLFDLLQARAQGVPLCEHFSQYLRRLFEGLQLELAHSAADQT